MPRSLSVRRLGCLAVVGGTATAAYAALTFLLSSLAGLPAAVASVTAYALAGLVSYFGHRGLTFGSRRPHREAVSPFIGVFLTGYALAFSIPALFSGMLGMRVELSSLITCVAVPSLTYLGMRRLVFPEVR